MFLYFSDNNALKIKSLQFYVNFISGTSQFLNTGSSNNKLDSCIWYCNVCDTYFFLLLIVSLHV